MAMVNSWDVSGNMVGYGRIWSKGQKVKSLILSMTFGVWTCIDSSWRIPQYDGVWGHFSGGFQPICIHTHIDRRARLGVLFMSWGLLIEPTGNKTAKMQQEPTRKMLSKPRCI